MIEHQPTKEDLQYAFRLGQALRRRALDDDARITAKIRAAFGAKPKEAGAAVVVGKSKPQQIYDFLAANQPMSGTAIAAALGFKVRLVRSALNSMREQFKVVSTGTQGNMVWHVRKATLKPASIAIRAILFLCALCVSANAQPFLPKPLAAAVVAPKPVSITLAWDSFEPKAFLSGSTNKSQLFTVDVSPLGMFTQMVENISIVNRYYWTKPATNYTLWNGTNLAASTTGLAATVSYPRGTTPTFALRATTADGQAFGTGTFSMPTNPQASALLSVWIETAGNFTNAWRPLTNASLVLDAAALTAPSGFYRARLALAPLGTNASALAFTPQMILLTNAMSATLNHQLSTP